MPSRVKPVKRWAGFVNGQIAMCTASSDHYDNEQMPEIFPYKEAGLNSGFDDVREIEIREVTPITRRKRR